MKSTVHTTSKRGGIQLSPKDIDAAKAVGDHNRDEAFKNAINLAKIIGIGLAVLGIPVIYICILLANWQDSIMRNEWLEKGLVGVLAFALGKVDFNFGTKKSE